LIYFLLAFYFSLRLQNVAAATTTTTIYGTTVMLISCHHRRELGGAGLCILELLPLPSVSNFCEDRARTIKYRRSDTRSAGFHQVLYGHFDFW
jgi:hypothetical protein